MERPSFWKFRASNDHDPHSSSGPLFGKHNKGQTKVSPWPWSFCNWVFTRCVNQHCFHHGISSQRERGLFCLLFKQETLEKGPKKAKKSWNLYFMDWTFYPDIELMEPRFYFMSWEMTANSSVLDTCEKSPNQGFLRFELVLLCGVWQGHKVAIYRLLFCNAMQIGSSSSSYCNAF